MKRSIALCVIAGCGLFASQSAAATLDFSDLVSSDCNQVSVTGGVDTGGYHFDGNPVDPGLYLCDAGVLQSNTTPALINANDVSLLILTQIGGGPFTLNSFSAGTRLSGGPYGVTTGLDIIGTLFGGGLVSTSVVFNGDEFGSFTLPGTFTNLTSVAFSASGTEASREFLINNITVDEAAVSEAPEPGTFLLLSAGLVGAGLLRRKRSA